MKKNKKYQAGGPLFVTMPFGGSVANSPIIPGQLPDYQMGSNVNSGVIQNNLRDIQHFYGSNFPYMAEGGDMEDESGATDSFYTNKLNGFIDKVRGTAQKNLENNLLKEAMREMRGDDETVEYGPQDMEMAQYGMSTGDQSQNTYDPSYINNFANAYSKTKSFTDSLQNFAKMNRIIQPTTEYQKIKRKFDLGFTDRFKEDNPWVDSSGNPVNYTKASFEDGGTLIPMFQGDEDESTVDFWTPEEMQYLKSLPKKDRDAIISKGDAQAKQQVQAVIGSQSQPQAQAQPQAQPTPKKTATPGAAPVTANNTSVNTTSGTTPTTTGTTPATTNAPAATNTNPAANAFEGYTFHTDANGNKYIVTPEGQMYSPYMGAASSSNVYSPQEYYTPYNIPSGTRTYSFSERNQLTPEFREAMRSGALNNPQPQLLGLPHIEYRKALFPKNRNKEVKSISWQYGKLYGDPFGEDMSMEPGPAKSNTTTGSTTQKKTTGPDIDPSLLPENNPKVKQATDWNYRLGQDTDYFPPSGGWKDMPEEGPLNLDAAGPREGLSAYDRAIRATNKPTNSINTLTVLGREMANANLKKGQEQQAAYEKMIEDAAIRDGIGTGAFMPQIGSQAYNLSENEFEKYGNTGYDFPLTPVVENGQVTGWRDLTDTDAGYPRAYAYDPRGNLSIPLNDAAHAQQVANRNKRDKQLKKGIKFDYNGNVIKKEGGTMLPIFQGVTGPSTFTDMAEEEEYGPIIDPTTGKPLESKVFSPMTDIDRINAVDSGTEYEKTGEEPNTWFIENPFNVEEKFKTRKKRDPWKAIRNINLATGFFNLDETAGLKNQLKKATQASEAFADVGNSWGQYHPLTGQYMGPKGKQPPVINTGFAQYGGSLYDNLKQGDEMYLTQGQIDELLKRGVKLSYLD